MTPLDTSERLRHLSMLFLSMAHRADDYLSAAELDSITEKLHAHEAALDWTNVQEIVMESLEVYTRTDDTEELGRAAAAALQESLTPVQKRHVLDDLSHIARADGIVLEGERGLLFRLARRWGVPFGHEEGEALSALQAEAEAWTVLHCLAYLYLHLAHATDNELSTQEMQVMRNKLHEWQPQYPEAQIAHVLDAATQRYARGVDEDLLEASVAMVRDTLPHAQRMAALDDLIKIANADGIFLDVEEDMINHLLAAWDVDPSANYGNRGEK